MTCCSLEESRNATRVETVITSATMPRDRKSTRLNSSHSQISYAVFCLKKKKKIIQLDCKNRLMNTTRNKKELAGICSEQISNHVRSSEGTNEQEFRGNKSISWVQERE